MRFIFVLLLIIPSGLSTGTMGQAEFGIVAGISNYQGDLASVNTQDGFKALIGPVIGIHGGYELSPRVQVRGDLLYTRIEGDDSLSENPDAQRRNLDFFAPLLQLASGFEWNIFGHPATKPKYITPYISAGASIFYFNPKTKYEGQTVALHPLGTEGQYLDDYPDQKPYSLFQPSLQLGGGLKLLIQKKFVLALEGMLSYTFTDYLDDASTIYISYPELLEKAGPLTAALANRQGEYLGIEPIIEPTGSARANDESRDLFGMITLRCCVPVKLQSDEFKIRRHNRKKAMDCPKF